jgi:putative nucleotidyltransferase with HDIG domain
MTSFLRRLFGNPVSTAASPATRPTATVAHPAERTARTPGPRATSPAATSPAPKTGTGSESSHASGEAPNGELRARFLAALRQIEAELITDDPITADLQLLVNSLRDHPIERIRQLPVAAQRALSLLHGDAATKALVALFEQDPAICQALLQTVNSAHYNPSGARIVSLPDAINRIGRAGVQCVVMEQSVAGMVSRPGGFLDQMVQQVWNHMVRVGPIARMLAPAFDANPDQAFLLGLLHDVGKLAVFDRVTELRSSQRRVLILERRMLGRALGLLHESLGGMIVEQWKLDGDVARAVASHHRDPRPVPRDVLSEVVYLAERIDLMRELKQTPDLSALWQDGALTGSIEMASRALAEESAENAA